MEHKILIDIEYLGKILKYKSLNKEDTQSILLELIDHSNLINPTTVHKETVNEIIDKLFDEPKVELSDFEKLLQKAINFNPKKK